MVARWSLLVLALTAVLLALLWRRFYYGNDDLLEFSVARDDGLSWTTLSLNVWQHFGPYNRLAHLIVFKFTDLAPAAGIAFMTVNYLGLLVAALWFMTELRLSARRRVLALVLIGLSVSVSESGIWFDAAMHILPAMAVTLAVCAAHVRGVRGGGRRWHVLALVLFVLGQLTQERPLFALPIAVLADLLLLWRTLPWRDRWQRLWQIRRPILALTAAATVIAVVLRLFVVEGKLPTPGWGTTARTMLSAFSNYFLPSLANLPLAAPAPVLVQALVLLAVILAGVAVARMRPGNAGPLLFAAAVFAMYYGFLKASPLLNSHTVTANAMRLHNAVYVTVPAIIGLVHLRAPAGLRFPSPALRARLFVPLIAVVAVALTVSNNAYLARQWAGTTAARAYLDAVRADSAQWSDPAVTLVPLSAPAAMGTGWSEPFLRQDRLLDLVVKGFRPQDLGSRPVLIDDTGAVRPAVLAAVPRTATLVSGECGTATASQPLELRLSSRVSGGPFFLLVRYRADGDLMAHMTAGAGSRDTANHFLTHVWRGEHTQVLPIDATRLDRVTLRPVTGGPGFCAESVQVARPLVRQPEDGSCRPVDRYGRPGTREECP